MDSSGEDTKIVGDTGRRKPPRAGMGRPKGSPNKTTRTLKEALLASFETLGGEEWLVQLAGSDPKAYAGLLGRLVPSEISAEVVSTTFPELPDGLILTPKSFPNREAWNDFFDKVKKQPDAIVIHGGAPPPPGFTGNVFPIARRVNGSWVLGGLPNPDELSFYDLDFDAPPGMTLPPAS